MKIRSISRSATVLAAFLSLSALCIAQDIDVSAVIEGRQANLRDLGAALKGVTDELKKPAPTMSLVRQYAKQINDLAQQQHFWFPAGSGPQAEVDTKAKPEIWTKPAEFSQAQVNFTREASKFLEAVAGNDLEAVKVQHRALGKSCQGCHKEFREKTDD